MQRIAEKGCEDTEFQDPKNKISGEIKGAEELRLIGGTAGKKSSLIISQVSEKWKRWCVEEMIKVKRVTMESSE